MRSAAAATRLGSVPRFSRATRYAPPACAVVAPGRSAGRRGSRSRTAPRSRRREGRRGARPRRGRREHDERLLGRVRVRGERVGREDRQRQPLRQQRLVELAGAHRPPDEDTAQPPGSSGTSSISVAAPPPRRSRSSAPGRGGAPRQLGVGSRRVERARGSRSRRGRAALPRAVTGRRRRDARRCSRGRPPRTAHRRTGAAATRTAGAPGRGSRPVPGGTSFAQEGGAALGVDELVRPPLDELRDLGPPRGSVRISRSTERRG